MKEIYILDKSCQRLHTITHKFGVVSKKTYKMEILPMEANAKTSGIERLESADLAAGGQRRPFAKAVRAGDFVYVSGQVPAVDGEIITGGIVAQTEQVMRNIIDVLKTADCGIEHVVKVNAWLDDPRAFSSFNGVFEK